LTHHPRCQGLENACPPLRQLTRHEAKKQIVAMKVESREQKRAQQVNER
jgi:hypothetical protein